MDILTKVVLINWILLLTAAVLDSKYDLIPDWIGNLWSATSVILLPIWLVYIILYWGEV